MQTEYVNIYVVLVIGGTMLIVILSLLGIAIANIHQKKMIRHSTEMALLKNTYTNELMQTQLEMQEETLKYVSKEIHDNISSKLATIRILMESLCITNYENPEKIVSKSIQITSELSDEIRYFGQSLNRELLAEVSIVDIIKKHLSVLEKARRYKITTIITGERVDLSTEKTLNIFRIFQEAINNIVKHARANKITVTIAFNDQSIELYIIDDGIGFCNSNLYDPEKIKSFGLSNMAKRARQINSQYTIESLPGKGTSIHIKTPLYD